MAEAEHQPLSLQTQTAYARLTDLLLTGELGGSEVAGTPVVKTVRGRRYWYAQTTRSGKKVQRYIGPESPEIARLIDRWKRARSRTADRAELVAQIRAGSAQSVGAAVAHVLRSLAPAFQAGAVLVGSHAFAVLGNILGVRWQAVTVMTEDIDIAQDRRLAVALARDASPANLPDLLGEAIPLFSILDPSAPATSFRVRGAEIEVEVLTPRVGRDTGKPVQLLSLGVAATPLRFLDYLIENTQPAAVVGGSGSLVHVPDPARFAMHKLIVASRRSARTGPTKSPKDRAQASALLQVLLVENPGAITLAWRALTSRGNAWTRAASRSLARLDSDLVSQLAALGVAPMA